MPNYKEKLDTVWLKAKVNIQDGDMIRILSDKEDDKGNVIIQVGILEGGVVMKEKQFQLNRTNIKAVMDAYGFESENWKGKDMKVSVVRVRNPQTGEKVDSIELEAPFNTATGLENSEKTPF
jgi:hypothetical protein